jgi:hypothetical protein
MKVLLVLKKSTIIYPSSSKSGGYVFNVNEYLRGKSVSTLMKLTLLSDVAKFTLKPKGRVRMIIWELWIQTLLRPWLLI